MEIEKSSFETQVEEAAEKAGGILRSRYGLWALGALSFAESALVVPIVTDPFLVAYILANKAAAIRGVIVTLATSLLGGLFAYAVAFWFYEFIAAQYLHGHMAEQFAVITQEFQKGTFVISILGAVTPVPYTIVAMAAGFVKANVLVFLLASIIGRGFRYAVVGWLTYKYGEQALAIARRQMILVSILCFIAAAVYFFFIH